MEIIKHIKELPKCLFYYINIAKANRNTKNLGYKGGATEINSLSFVSFGSWRQAVLPAEFWLK